MNTIKILVFIVHSGQRMHDDGTSPIIVRITIDGKKWNSPSATPYIRTNGIRTSRGVWFVFILYQKSEP